MSTRVLTLILLGCLTSAGIVVAQDNQDDEVGVAAKPEIRVRVRAQNIVLFEQAVPRIDRLIFPDSNEQAPRQLLENQLKARTEEIHHLCQLDDGQLRKLTLAGRTEIKRLFDRVDACRRKWSGLEQDPNSREQMLREVRPLRATLTTTQFRDGSFFEKVVRKTLTAEQLAAYQQQIETRHQERRLAQRERLLTVFEPRAPLTAEQRDSLSKLLDKVRVPDGQWEQIRFVLAAATTSEEDYQAILNETQWTLLQASFREARRIEGLLRQRGQLVFDDAPEE